MSSAIDFSSLRPPSISTISESTQNTSDNPQIVDDSSSLVNGRLLRDFNEINIGTTENQVNIAGNQNVQVGDSYYYNFYGSSMGES